MNCGELSALTRRNDISMFAACNVNRSDIILVSGPISQILSSLQFLLEPSKDLLTSSFEILDHTKRCSGKHDLVVGLAKVQN